MRCEWRLQGHAECLNETSGALSYVEVSNVDWHWPQPEWEAEKGMSNPLNCLIQDGAKVGCL